MFLIQNVLGDPMRRCYNMPRQGTERALNIHWLYGSNHSLLEGPCSAPSVLTVRDTVSRPDIRSSCTLHEEHRKLSSFITQFPPRSSATGKIVAAASYLSWSKPWLTLCSRNLRYEA